MSEHVLLGNSRTDVRKRGRGKERKEGEGRNIMTLRGAVLGERRERGELGRGKGVREEWGEVMDIGETYAKGKRAKNVNTLN